MSNHNIGFYGEIRKQNSIQGWTRPMKKKKKKAIFLHLGGQCFRFLYPNPRIELAL